MKIKSVILALSLTLLLGLALTACTPPGSTTATTKTAAVTTKAAATTKAPTATTKAK